MTWIAIVLLMVYSGYEWHEGGSGKWWARPTICFVLGGMKALFIWNPWGFAYGFALYAMLSLFSYGISAPPHKFVVFLFKKGEDGNCFIVEAVTRGLVAFFWSLPAVIFALLTGHWWRFALYVLFLTLANAYFGTRKDVEISERGVGASVSCSLWI